MDESMVTLKRVLLLLPLFAAPLSDAQAGQWADSMIETRKVDFGVIATGSEARKYVVVKNVHSTDVHIASVETTCGCSAAAVGKRTLRPGESAEIEIKMNTQKFRQRKDSNLIIRFDRPKFDEARVPITAYIRTDVVFNPGMIRFGDVDAGTEATAVVDIAYAGRSDRDIGAIKITNKNLKAVLSAPVRRRNEIHFKLTMTLSAETPPGRLRDLVTIVTNDRRNPFVPLMIDGTVTADITATPPTLSFGQLAAGKSRKLQLVLRGKKPFSVSKIDCEDLSDCFEAGLSKQSRTLHIVPIQFRAPDQPGRFSEELTVRIAGRTEPLRISVTGTITN